MHTPSRSKRITASVRLLASSASLRFWSSSVRSRRRFRRSAAATGTPVRKTEARKACSTISRWSSGAAISEIGPLSYAVATIATNAIQIVPITVASRPRW